MPPWSGTSTVVYGASGGAQLHPALPNWRHHCSCIRGREGSARRQRAWRRRGPRRTAGVSGASAATSTPVAGAATPAAAAAAEAAAAARWCLPDPAGRGSGLRGHRAGAEDHAQPQLPCPAGRPGTSALGPPRRRSSRDFFLVCAAHPAVALSAAWARALPAAAARDASWVALAFSAAAPPPDGVLMLCQPRVSPPRGARPAGRDDAARKVGAFSAAQASCDRQIGVMSCIGPAQAHSDHGTAPVCTHLLGPVASDMCAAALHPRGAPLSDSRDKALISDAGGSGPCPQWERQGGIAVLPSKAQQVQADGGTARVV